MIPWSGWLPAFGSPAVRLITWPAALRPHLAMGLPVSGRGLRLSLFDKFEITAQW